MYKYYKKDKAITAQEGDFPAPIVITVPDILPLAGYVVTFIVMNNTGKIFIRKTSTNGGIIVVEQIMTINFVKTDTQGKAGTHRWELQLHKENEEEITIGGGPFTITPTYIK